MTVVQNKKQGAAGIAILVAALGYFVDIYDLLLFSIVRVKSLEALGKTGHEITSDGIFLLNVQMAGMLIGGIIWGVLGDKKGRISVLFGSILIYSLGNLANGFAGSVEAYAVCRLIAGFGLAGELGAGITLVAELMPKEKRGYATTIVSAVGVSGAVAAYFIAQYFDWRTCYFIGGGLGILLLLMRVGVSESGMFHHALKEAPKKSILYLLSNRKRVVKYLRCIIIGVPLWFVVGILITLSPEFGQSLGIRGAVDPGLAVACCYGGLVIGDIISGLLSQWLKSRVKVVYIFLILSVLVITAYFFLAGIHVFSFYILCFLLGISVGYWVIFMTIATEQFGTNVRATVTTTAPNFVRGAVVPLSMLFQWLMTIFNGSLKLAGITVAIIVFLLAFWALSGTEETFSKDLDYVEE
jgi:putative MFS transporter